MSSTLPAFFVTLDVSPLIESNIHSTLVGVNHIGMDREHPGNVVPLRHIFFSRQERTHGVTVGLSLPVPSID